MNPDYDNLYGHQQAPSESDYRDARKFVWQTVQEEHRNRCAGEVLERFQEARRDDGRFQGGKRDKR